MYSSWMQQSFEAAYGKCAEITLAMAQACPELKRVRGHYICPIWGEREHWWLIDSTGLIIDPTAIQFPSKGHGEYIEWVEGTPEPTGICPNCGSYCYDNKSFCSDNCELAYMAYLRSI